MKRTALPAALLFALTACSPESAAEPAAAPEPVAPEPAAPEADDTPEAPAPAAQEDEEATEATDTEQAAPEEGTEPAEQAPAKTTKAAPKPAPKPVTKPEPKADTKPEAEPAPKADTKPKAEPAPKAEAKPEPTPPTGRTRIPQSDHVQVQVPAKLQALLDGDSRMQGWINQVMRVAEQCYAQVRGQSPKAGGTIVVNVTMHENSRPAPDIKSLPPALSNLVACATGRLFNVRMPLFTGPEGQKHQVKLIFKP